MSYSFITIKYDVSIPIFDIYFVFTQIYNFTFLYVIRCGLGRSVGLATDCGLEGPGSNPGGDKIFRPSRPAMGPSQPPVPWVPGLSRE
jgi:hypothetical protein